MTLCPWADSAPAGLCDAAEGWGLSRLPSVFRRAHGYGAKDHEDTSNPGHCYVCGAPLDFEAWLDAEMEADHGELQAGGFAQ